MASRYSESFKSNVVQKVRDGKTPKEAAAESGVSTYAVRDWLKAADEAASSRPMTPQEHAEIKRLRKENNDLREERDILKKATAYFARNPT
jgi:transposase